MPQHYGPESTMWPGCVRNGLHSPSWRWPKNNPIRNKPSSCQLVMRHTSSMWGTILGTSRHVSKLT